MANSRHSSHLHHCGQNSQPSHIPITGVNEDNLPSFEEVCDLKCPTLRFVPHKSRAAFARALSSTLRSVINDNSEQAWLKLLMFSKCVLPSSKRKSRHHNPASVDFLCDLWSKNAFATLWNLAKGRANSIPRSNNTSPETSEKIVQSAVSLARDGLLGKACRVLLSESLAPNNDATWQLLISKHPVSPPPTVPDVSQTPTSLGRDFDIHAVLRSFPNGTAAGPSGMYVQHLIDAASIPLPTPICSSLRSAVNLLASGKVSIHCVSKCLAGGSLTALNKFKPGCNPDIMGPLQLVRH